jgi:hypothetical protein
MSVMDIGDPNPLAAKLCAQLETVCYADEVSGEPLFETEHEETCARPLVWERHGDETVYMCVEHGWQATVFEEDSDDTAP